MQQFRMPQFSVTDWVDAYMSEIKKILESLVYAPCRAGEGLYVLTNEEKVYWQLHHAICRFGSENYKGVVANKAPYMVDWPSYQDTFWPHNVKAWVQTLLDEYIYLPTRQHTLGWVLDNQEHVTGQLRHLLEMIESENISVSESVYEEHMRRCEGPLSQRIAVCVLHRDGVYREVPLP